MRPQTLPPLSFDPALLGKALRLGIDQGRAKLLSATYSFKPGDSSVEKRKTRRQAFHRGRYLVETGYFKHKKWNEERARRNGSSFRLASEALGTGPYVAEWRNPNLGERLQLKDPDIVGLKNCEMAAWVHYKMQQQRHWCDLIALVNRLDLID